MSITSRTWSQRIRRSLEGCRPGLSFGLIMFEDGFCFDLFGFLIAIPFLDRYVRAPHEILDDWRIYYGHRSVVLNWGPRFHKYWRMPWAFEHIKVEVLRPDGAWVKEVPSYSDEPPDGRRYWTFDYRYTLKSGEVQERTARVYVERREWRWRCLKWCPWFATVRKSIDYTFSDEVGERTGSWKGGCISSGEDMRRGETVEQCFRRMERERKF